MLQILKPRIFIKNLSSDKIDFRLIGILFFTYALMISFNLFSKNKAFDDLIYIFKSTLSPLNQSQGMRVFVDIIIMFLLYFLVVISTIAAANLVVKRITLLLKKKIYYYSLLNISVYSIFLACFLNLILTLAIFIFNPIVVNFSDNQKYLFVILPATLINIFSFIVYIYGVIITVRANSSFPIVHD